MLEVVYLGNIPWQIFGNA